MPTLTTQKIILSGGSLNELQPRDVQGNVLSLIANKSNNGYTPSAVPSVNPTTWGDLSKISNLISYSNLVANGDFSNSNVGYTEYLVSGSSYINNECKFTPTSQYGTIFNKTIPLFIATNKYYMRAEACGDADTQFYISDQATFTFSMEHSSNISYEKMSMIITLPAIVSNITKDFGFRSKATSDWIEIGFKELFIINLTALGLENLTAEECDSLFPFTPLNSPSTATTSRPNNATILHQAGSSSSGWNSEVINGKTMYYNRFEGVDDVGMFISTPSLDITTNEIVIAKTFRIATGETTSWILNKSEDAENETQYGLKYNSTNENIELWLEGDVRATTNASSITQNAWYNVIFYRNSAGNITVYLNKVAQTGADYVGALTSRPNLRLGAISSNAEGTTHTAQANFDDGTLSIYSDTRLDITKIIKAETNISKNYGI